METEMPDVAILQFSDLLLYVAEHQHLLESAMNRGDTQVALKITTSGGREHRAQIDLSTMTQRVVGTDGELGRPRRVWRRNKASVVDGVVV